MRRFVSPCYGANHDNLMSRKSDDGHGISRAFGQKSPRGRTFPPEVKYYSSDWRESVKPDLP